MRALCRARYAARARVEAARARTAVDQPAEKTAAAATPLLSLPSPCTLCPGRSCPLLLLPAAHQNLNSGRRRTNGLNSWSYLVGSAGPSCSCSGSTCGVMNPISRLRL